MTRFSWILLLSVHVSVHALEIVRNSSCVSNLGKEGDPEFDNTNFRWGPEKLEGYWNGIVTLDKLVGRGGQSDGVYFATLDCGDGHPEKVAIKRIVVKGTVCFESKAGEKRTKRRNRLPTLHKYYDECERHIAISTQEGADTNMVLEYDHQPRESQIFDEAGFHSLFIMMPLFAGGDLFHAIRDEEGKKKLDQEKINRVAARLAYDVFQGLEQLHSKGYTHCDLKPVNILMSHKDCIDETYKAYQAWNLLNKSNNPDDRKNPELIKSSCKFMVSDFGLTRRTADLEPHMDHGTRAFFPPEVKSGYSRKYFVRDMKQNVSQTGWSPKGDVFAAGLVLMDFLSRKTNSFQKSTRARWEKNKRLPPKKMHRVLEDKFSSWVDADLLFLLSSVLQPHPFERPTAKVATGIAEKAFAKLWSFSPPLLLPKREVPKCLQTKGK
eukprot:TRINITY_DN2031_c0_g1_i3.p1 TRINITY_DN2031_c0_g1~~TRINITY_DN2031_c0_g1_i3.p1  ORF type:complete len:437 (-),score=34.01 TRINITY_DN2031_c0_g1_i3:191-1501(-)